MRVPFVFLSALFVLLISGSPGAVPSAAADKPFYEGKTIRFIVPYTPGGGFDVYARIISRHLPNHIPGKPTIFVQNMPGGGGSIGPNYIYNVAKADGLTIGQVHGNQTVSQLTDVPGVHYRVEKFKWIGGTDLGPVVLGIRNELRHKTIDDFRGEKPVFLTASTPGNNTYDYPMILKLYGNLNLKITPGYRGSSAEIAAIQRGEADGRGGSMTSILRYGILRVVIGDKRARPVVPDIIDDKKIVTSQEGRNLIDALGAPQRIGRGLAAPPAVPAERVELLRTAWNKLAQDQRFLKEIKKAVLLNPEDVVKAAEVEQVLDKVQSLPKETWDLLKNKIQKR